MARSEEQGPNGHQEDEELESDGEEEAFAGCAAGLQPVGPHDNRKKQEDQRCCQHQQPHTQANCQGEIAAEALGPVLNFFPQTDHFLLGNTQLGGAGHCSGGFPPVIILTEGRKKSEAMGVCFNMSDCLDTIVALLKGSSNNSQWKKNIFFRILGYLSIEIVLVCIF